MSEHQCFTVSPTSYLRHITPDDLREPCFAVHYQKAPEKRDDGSQRISLKIPALMVTGYLSEPEKIAQRVADILNKHWDDEHD